jgi:thermitase
MGRCLKSSLGGAIAVVLLVGSASSAFAASDPVRPDLSPAAVPGELLIKFKSGVSSNERAAVLAKHRGRTSDTIARLDIQLVEFADLKGRDSRTKARAKARDLKRDGRVQFAEPNYIYRASFTPNDPSLGQQWAWARIQAFSAWDTTQGSSATKIAIVDTGIQRSHPDLDAKIVAGYDYVSGDSAPDDGNGHGTHVGGTAAAETNNGTGGAGSCPNCSLMPVRVLDNSGSGSLVNVANGIRWAADNGAKVINLSLGGPGSSTLQSAVDYATGKGAFLACAAGNSNTSSTTSAYPGAYANCFAVASTTTTDARSSFSNYGGWVEAAAPGSSIYSTWLNSGYNTISGTSMATPHVAGLGGLLSSQGLTNAQIRARICSTADRIAGTGSLWTCGRINDRLAVGGSPPPPPPPASEKIVNGGFESGTAPWTQTSTGGYQLIDSTRPHAGSYSAWLGGYNSGTDAVSQTVSVPASGALSYWWYLTTQESGSTPYDYFRVRLYNSSGTLIATPRTFTNASGAGLWRQDALSLASYAGQTVRIEFSATTDFSLPSSFFVDDVSLK